MLPGVGAVIGGGLDLVETKVIADRAYKWFFMGDFSEASKEDNIIDIEDADFDEIIPEEKHESQFNVVLQLVQCRNIVLIGEKMVILKKMFCTEKEDWMKSAVG